MEPNQIASSAVGRREASLSDPRTWPENILTADDFEQRRELDEMSIRQQQAHLQSRGTFEGQGG